MNDTKLNTQAMKQGHKAADLYRQVFLALSYHRSLKQESGGLRPLRTGFMPLLRFLSLLLFVIVAALSSGTAVAQEVEDTIRIKTRVVFLDALVKDKKTSQPIANLTPENFEVYDNGKVRPISYFTREGQARKPLALVLIMDLREDGAGRFLREPEILKAMHAELAKLPPEDEVAVMVMNTNGEDETRLWLTEFTNDRQKLSAALARVPAFCNEESAAAAAAKEPKPPQPDVPSETKLQETQAPSEPAAAQAKPKSEAKDVVETETITGRNGTIITRTTHKDGSVDVKRVSKSGKMTVEAEDIYDMAAAVRDSTKKGSATRPNSQLSLVWISDGIAPIFFEDRDATEQILIKNNVIFSSLTVELRTLFKFLMPIGKPIAGWMGVSLYGSAKYLAQRSGGEAVKVNRIKDYATGLSRIIGNLTARYSVGFTLDENETDDGRMHALEVRVKAKDEKGKSRKLLVSSRQGYYMSTAGPKDVNARAQ
jgi:VWFA-related protein